MSEPSSAIADTPTPGDIEAALSDLRAQLGTAAPAPEAAPARPVEAPRRPGWGGTAALMLAAALLGGGAASLLPGLLGTAPQGSDEARRRLDMLESRVGGLAAGQSSDTAAQAFADIKAHLDGLDVRLRALEQASATPPSGADNAALAAAQQSLNELTARIVTLENRLSQLAQQPAVPAAPAPETAGEIAALKTAIADLTARLGTLERVAPAGDLVASLDGRVSALEQADPGRASRQAALALIVARLGDAAADGRGFTAELAALKQAAPAVDTTAFEPYAAEGLPTIARLADQLAALDGAVRDGADYGGLVHRFWRGLGRLITVRQDGLAEGMEPEDHLARAEYHAGRGDLANAYAEMDRLTGAATRRGGALDRAGRRPTGARHGAGEADRTPCSPISPGPRHDPPRLAVPPRCRTGGRRRVVRASTSWWKSASGRPPTPCPRRGGGAVRAGGCRAAGIWRLIGFVFDWPGAMSRARRERRRRARYLSLARMVAVAAGDAREARRHAAKAKSKSRGKGGADEPLLAQLLNVQTAQLDGDEVAAARAYADMLGAEETEFLGLRGLFVQATRRHDRDAARRYAARAFHCGPRRRGSPPPRSIWKPPQATGPPPSGRSPGRPRPSCSSPPSSPVGGRARGGGGTRPSRRRPPRTGPETRRIGAQGRAGAAGGGARGGGGLAG